MKMSPLQLLLLAEGSVIVFTASIQGGRGRALGTERVLTRSDSKRSARSPRPAGESDIRLEDAPGRRTRRPRSRHRSGRALALPDRERKLRGARPHGESFRGMHTRWKRITTLTFLPALKRRRHRNRVHHTAPQQVTATARVHTAAAFPPRTPPAGPRSSRPGRAPLAAASTDPAAPRDRA